MWREEATRREKGEHQLTSSLGGSDFDMMEGGGSQGAQTREIFPLMDGMIGTSTHILFNMIFRP